MLPISDSVKKEFVFINQTIGKGDILQAVVAAKEGKDAIAPPPPSEPAQKKITKAILTRRSFLDKVEPEHAFEVKIIMEKNPFDTSECSVKEEYFFQWSDTENIWRLERFVETN